MFPMKFMFLFSAQAKNSCEKGSSIDDRGGDFIVIYFHPIKNPSLRLFV